MSQFSLACHSATFLMRCMMLRNGGQVTKDKENCDTNINVNCVM